MKRSRTRNRTRAVAAVCTVALAAGLAVSGSSTAASATTVAAAKSSNHAAPKPIYLDTRYSFAERAADLVSRMTLAEKAVPAQHQPGAGHPAVGCADLRLVRGGDAARRVPADGQQQRHPGTQLADPDARSAATSFPTDLSTSLAWDPKAVLNETDAISTELRGYLDKSLYGTGPNNLGPSGQRLRFAVRVLADGEPAARPALGPHRRGFRRGPLSGRSAGQRLHRRDAGPRPQR